MCKEQFSLTTEDPDDQVIVTLPCKHPFHEGCIMPWLKSSGTCPVCRYGCGVRNAVPCLCYRRFQLVPQPEHHPPPPNGPASGSGGSPGPPVNRGTRPDAPTNGMFGQFFNIMGGSGNSSNSSRANRNPPPREEWEHEDLPGAWLD